MSNVKNADSLQHVKGHGWHLALTPTQRDRLLKRVSREKKQKPASVVCEAPLRSLTTLATQTAGQLAAAQNRQSLSCASRRRFSPCRGGGWRVRGVEAGARMSASPASLRTSELAVRADKRRRRRQSC